MTTKPDQHVTEEPQAERGEPGSRDTGSDHPSAGPSDRQSGTIDDEAAPSHGAEDSAVYGGTGELPPQGTKPFLPPYEGRSQTETNPRSGSGESAGFSTDTAGAASPAEEQPAPPPSKTESGVGPAHTPGTGRAEDKR